MEEGWEVCLKSCVAKIDYRRGYEFLERFMGLSEE